MTEARETHTTSNVSEGHPVPSGRTDCYLGIDIGSISTKGVIIDADRRIIARTYLWTEGNPADAARRVVPTWARRWIATRCACALWAPPAARGGWWAPCAAPPW